MGVWVGGISDVDLLGRHTACTHTHGTKVGVNTAVEVTREKALLEIVTAECFRLDM